jgi:5-(carboxyamino)imidazole ribonucleotide synthase
MSHTVGVIGGGQLARMMIPAATHLGVNLHVFAETEGSPAALAATAVGDYRDPEQVLAWARAVDVVTFDHEHVPQDVLAALVDAGIDVRPGPSALLYAQDKILMREKLSALGMPVPDWAKVENTAELDDFIAAHGGAAVVKTPRGGYDGKGVLVVRSANEAREWFETGPLLAEELVDFRREIAQSVARRPSGEVVPWTLVESIQTDGVCTEVIAPAPRSAGRIADVAEEIAVGIAEGLGVTGVMAVEMFETADDRILVNELAMRPHNSGHWTIEGSTTSQFEQHLRAVLDLPLGVTGCRDRWAVMVNVLGGPEGAGLTSRYSQAMAEHPFVSFHSYAKESRPGRKVGHVTICGDDLDDAVYQARAAADIVSR